MVYRTHLQQPVVSQLVVEGEGDEHREGLGCGSRAHEATRKETSMIGVRSIRTL